MKGTSHLTIKKNLSFSKDVVKHLSRVVQKKLPADVVIVAVSEKESWRLNRMYRQKDKPTNVLSFFYGKEYGEIIVCPTVIRREAKAQGNSFAYQMTWMIVHGMIHLSGVHHEASASKAKRFEKIEQRVLKSIAAR